MENNITTSSIITTAKPDAPYVSAQTTGSSMPTGFVFNIREVENGFILTHNLIEYIFESSDDLADFIKKTITKTKKKNRCIIE